MRLISSLMWNSWEGSAGDAAIRLYNSGANYPSLWGGGQAVVGMCVRKLSSEWEMKRFRRLKRRGTPRLYHWFFHAKLLIPWEPAMFTTAAFRGRYSWP